MTLYPHEQLVAFVRRHSVGILIILGMLVVLYAFWWFTGIVLIKACDLSPDHCSPTLNASKLVPITSGGY